MEQVNGQEQEQEQWICEIIKIDLTSWGSNPNPNSSNIQGQETKKEDSKKKKTAKEKKE